MYWSRWLVPLCLALLLQAGCAQVPTAPEPPPLPTTAQAGDTTIVAVAPAEPRQCCSVWDFMGVGQIVGGLRTIGTRIRSRLGTRFPGLEPRPPLVPITDPSNLGPEASPAVQTAAEVKAEEDQAAQKAKAINYLATIGCGGCDRGIEEALLSALDDCTEEVRYAAAKAFRDLSGSPCAVCKTDACCSEAALKKLHQIAYDTKNGCYIEPSPRVRRMARMALAGCGGYVAGVETVEVLPEEGPTPADLPNPPAGAPGAAPQGGVEARSILRDNRSVRAGAAPARANDPLVAEVNGEPIYRSELARRVELRLAGLSGLAGMQAGETVRQSVERRELDDLIERRLLLQEARRHLTPEQVRQVAFHTLDAPGRRPERILADSGNRDAVDEEQLVATWLEQSLRVPSEIREEELRAYYQANLTEYQSPADVRWEQITVPAEAMESRNHAVSVIRYLRGVAQGRPVSPAPVFQRQDVVTRAHALTPLDQVRSPQLASQLLNLPVGRISEPWEDANGWHLVRVLERQPAHTMPLEEVRESVRESVMAQRRLEAEREYVLQLRRQARIWTVFGGGAEQKTGVTAADAGPEPLPSPARIASPSLPASTPPAGSPPAAPVLPGSVPEASVPQASVKPASAMSTAAMSTAATPVAAMSTAAMSAAADSVREVPASRAVPAPATPAPDLPVRAAPGPGSAVLPAAAAVEATPANGHPGQVATPRPAASTERAVSRMRPAGNRFRVAAPARPGTRPKMPPMVPAQ